MVLELNIFWDLLTKKLKECVYWKIEILKNFFFEIDHEFKSFVLKNINNINGEELN